MRTRYSILAMVVVIIAASLAPAFGLNYTGSKEFQIKRVTGKLTAASSALTSQTAYMFTPKVTTGIGMFVDGTYVTSGDIFKLKVVSGTMTAAGRVFNIYDGASTIYSINDAGVVYLPGGGTIDNATSATVLNLTETTVRATGILDVTGNSTLASVDVGGGSGGSGATIAATGAATFDGALTANGGIACDTNKFTVADTSGNTLIAGSLTANGGIVCDTDKFAVADTTGIITLGGAGTIDNNTSATVMNLTETTVRATGILDVTGVITNPVTTGNTLVVNTNKFLVAADTGNTTIAGTLSVTGAITAPVEATVSETTATRACTSADYGKTIFCSNAGATTITLPETVPAAGTWIRFVRTGDEAMAINAYTVDTLITFNNVAADGVNYANTSDIGATCRVISTGSNWVAINESANNTMTVVDA